VYVGFSITVKGCSMSPSASADRVRLDVLLTERGLFDTRSKAAAAVLAGEVFVGQGRDRAAKPGQVFAHNIELEVAQTRRFVSRGGIKLDNALDALGLEVSKLRCLDVGASTGGFTDCLLQRGAQSVIAVDVAYGELAWSLRQDERVTVVERTNARDMKLEDLPWQPEFVVCDVSFIAVAKVIPAIAAVLPDGGEGLLLVKPQFEVGKDAVGRGGVVRDASVRRSALVSAGRAAESAGMGPLAFVSSGLPGPKGNKESLMWVRKGQSTPDHKILELAETAEP
jgi:23S rRNA (cytidine1920-2'-O)/16S rRNA (cytidine1409-2'-O)-methyltransferase